MKTTNSAKGDAKVETPLMKQYYAIKAKFPDALLLFRVGDFYETFGEDAIKAAGILGIILTRRANGAATFIELAGFPHHSLDTYLPKLVRAGQRVAICDQLEDPKMTKTIVKRGVTELITPGVSYNDKVLDYKTNNFLASVSMEGKEWGIAFLDISTGEFLVSQGSTTYIDKLLQSFRPSEVLFPKQKKKDFIEKFGDKLYSYGLDDWAFGSDFGYETLTKHFNTLSLKGFGLEELKEGISAAGAVLHYLSATQHDKVKHITTIGKIEESAYLSIDKFSARNLELFYASNEHGKSLIDILDCTLSPMGSRMMKRWLALPLKDKTAIDLRLNCVAFLVENAGIKAEVGRLLESIGDLERIVSKVATGRISPKEVAQLKRALSVIAPLKLVLASSNNDGLLQLEQQLDACTAAIERIGRELQEDPPFQLVKGNVIAKNVSAELDELRTIAYSGKDYLLDLQQREAAKTGIPSLKIAFNNVFGYYLEVTHTHKDKVPADWVRKQTLTNAERYITEELKQYEEKILGAEEKIVALETRLFQALVASLLDYIAPIQKNAGAIAQVDCLNAFATIAISNLYVRPDLHEGLEIAIQEGRHPVIERLLPIGVEYVSNDVFLDCVSQQICIITGPNMSGKSALLRQTALIVLMAQMGCFVPAKRASIGLVDKIFTRVGASDNLSSGESTFMVEMNETASILNTISERSLILLDEIGRGTSTYDGISIAWAIVEFLHEHQVAKAKTLFATHYHELNDLEGKLARVKNFNVSVKEVDNKVLFMRKLKPGGSEHSFGIHVAQMAGMPKKVVERATALLKELEAKSSYRNEQEFSNLEKTPVEKADGMQLSFFQLNDPVLEQIKDELVKTDINLLTPIEALVKLNEIKKLIGVV